MSSARIRMMLGRVPARRGPMAGLAPEQRSAAGEQKKRQEQTDGNARGVARFAARALLEKTNRHRASLVQPCTKSGLANHRVTAAIEGPIFSRRGALFQLLPIPSVSSDSRGDRRSGSWRNRPRNVTRDDVASHPRIEPDRMSSGLDRNIQPWMPAPRPIGWETASSAPGSSETGYMVMNRGTPVPVTTCQIEQNRTVSPDLRGLYDARPHPACRLANGSSPSWRPLAWASGKPGSRG